MNLQDAPMNDRPADKEKNRLSARALRYGSVGANVGGVAARIASTPPVRARS